jgi:hypothetical protein
MLNIRSLCASYAPALLGFCILSAILGAYTLMRRVATVAPQISPTNILSTTLLLEILTRKPQTESPLLQMTKSDTIFLGVTWRQRHLHWTLYSLERTEKKVYTTRTIVSIMCLPQIGTVKYCFAFYRSCITAMVKYQG